MRERLPLEPSSDFTPYTPRRLRRVVLIGHDNDGSLELYKVLRRSLRDLEYFVVVTQGLFYRRSLGASIWRLVTQASILFAIRRGLDILKYRIAGDTLVSRCRRERIPLIQTNDVNSAGAQESISGFGPDLIVLLYTMHILRPETARLARFGAIASHPSMLPHYRGLEVFFWALANGEAQTGVSVYFVDGRVDSGLVIRQEALGIGPEETVRSLYRRVTALASKMLCEAVRAIDAGTVTPHRATGTGSYYPMPTRDAYRRFQRSGRRWS